MAGTSNRIANQGVWVNSGFASANDAALFLPGQLGQVVIQGDKAYQLVQFDSGIVAVVATTPVIWKNTATFVVTDDYDAASTAGRNGPAGVALGTMTAGYYGWIQVAGPGTVYTKTSEAAAAGDALVYDAADSQCIKTAQGTAPVCVPLAIATGSQSTNATPANIIAPHNGW